MKRQRGNILFLILLAVVLFAALSYAVTSSMGGGAKNASAEGLQVSAAQILQYVTLMEQTVTRLRMTNNCTDIEISFKGVHGSYDRVPESRVECQVFNPAGGGMAIEKGMPTNALTAGSTPNYMYTGANYINQVGTSAADLILLHFNVSRDMCLTLNTMMGVTNPSGEPPYYANNPSWGYFNGTYYTGAGYNFNTAENSGQRTACIRTNYGGYNFYHVLIAR